jgi:hypothetical protein
MESGPSRNTEATSTVLGVVYHRLLAGESPQRASVLLVDNHPIPSQSLATGRLPTFSLPFVDCELPQDTEQLLAADGTPQVSCKYRAYTIHLPFHSFALPVPHWKTQFGKQCVSAVVAGILTARPPKYSVILELDRKVHEIELPPYALKPPPEGSPFSVVMQHLMPGNYRCLSTS